jgi:hypothetical protein
MFVSSDFIKTLRWRYRIHRIITDKAQKIYFWFGIHDMVENADEFIEEYDFHQLNLGNINYLKQKFR